MILSHVLEHSFDPESILSELQRIAPQGYIETPAAWQEYLIPYPFHCSYVTIIDGKLHIKIKQQWDEGLRIALPEVRSDLMKIWGERQKRRPEDCLTQMFWRRPLSFSVSRPASGVPWQKPREERSQASAKARTWKDEAYDWLVAQVYRAFKPRKPIDLARILCCPLCRGSLAIRPNGAQCESCKHEYGIRNGYLDLLVEPSAIA